MRRYITAVTALAGMFVIIAGVWSLLAPRSFADAVSFEFHEHFLHDIGAFQIGIGVTLFLALIWSDALITALAGFFVANSVHAVVHVVDLPLGGAAWQAWALAAMSVLIALAFVFRLRELGHVLGSVSVATAAELTPFVRQKTISLTTFRKDGTPGSTPVSIAVDGDRAYVRSFEKSLKTRRVRRNPTVEFGASTALGKPAGTALRGELRRLDGAEHRHAARLLRRKYPFLHGVLVPMTHRLGRAKTGRTVHFELTPRP